MTIKARLLGTAVGQYTMVVFGAVSLVMFGAVIFLGRGMGFAEAHRDAWAMILSPSVFEMMDFFPDMEVGLQAGIYMYTTACLGFNLLLGGVVVDNIRQLMDYARKTYSEVNSHNHILVINWSGCSVWLVIELLQMLTDEEDHLTRIVILSPLPPSEVRSHIRFYASTSRVTVRQGFVWSEDDLMKAGATRVRAVVYTYDRHTSLDTDLLSALVALRSMGVKGHVTAEVQTHRAFDVVTKMNSNISAMLTTDVWDCLVARTAIDQVIGIAFSELLTFTDQNLFTVDLPGEGNGLDSMQRLYPRSLVIGYISDGKLSYAAIRSPSRATVCSCSAKSRQRPRSGHRPLILTLSGGRADSAPYPGRR